MKPLYAVLEYPQPSALTGEANLEVSSMLICLEQALNIEGLLRAIPGQMVWWKDIIELLNLTCANWLVTARGGINFKTWQGHYACYR